MKRTAASPIVWVASWKPAPAKRAIAAAIRSGSGQNGVSPSPCVSGVCSHAVPGVDHAVGEELRDAAAPQLARARRAAAATARAAPPACRAAPTAGRAGAASARPCPRGRGGARRSRASRPSRARRSARARSAVAAARRGARAAPASAARARRAGPVPARPARAAHPVGMPSTHTISDPSAKSTGPVTCASSSARGEASALCRSASRTKTAASPSSAGARRRVVVQPPGEYPAAVRALARQRRQRLVLRAHVAEIEPAGQFRAPERVDVRVHEPGDERGAARVDDLRARVAVLAHVVADGHDHAVPHRHGAGERPRRVQRADPGVDDRELSGHVSVSRRTGRRTRRARSRRPPSAPPRPGTRARPAGPATPAARRR